MSAEDTMDNSYTSGANEEVPVVADDSKVESGLQADPDSDAALEQDDKEAISKDNIIEGERTRGAKPEGGYREPGDDEGLPGPEDGTSSN